MIDKRGTKPSVQLTKWKDYLVEMGYGYRLGVDLPSESRGFIPNADFYSKSFRGSKWSGNSVISVAIGQGEVLATPCRSQIFAPPSPTEDITILPISLNMLPTL